MSGSRFLCHEAPELYEFQARVLDTRPGAVALTRSAFYPGGGGQPADRGILRWNGGEVRVERCEAEGDLLWHVLAEPVVVEGAIEGIVDAAFRRQMCQLHTDLHLVNALAFQASGSCL
jgi:misacylated tRNA(Ala) deacylase